MPPQLDLSRTKHSKMMVSPPRLNLRKAASYKLDNGPLSATSSRFNFNHLLFSPPPSPSLPALAPRRPRRSASGLAPRPSRVFRLLLYSLGVLLVLYVAAGILVGGGAGGGGGHDPLLHHPLSYLEWWSTQNPGDELEVVGQYEMPDFPTPIAVKGSRGLGKWTFSVPRTYAFPLSVQEYEAMAAKCHEMASHVRETRGQPELARHAFFGDGFHDANFVDVQEAQAQGLLPAAEGAGVEGKAAAADGGSSNPSANPSSSSLPVCGRSLTFVLESSDAGLGPMLMSLWTLYGLARREGRAFFVDDSRWAYGSWESVFGAPTAARPTHCLAPPKHERLPCPRQARHLVVTPATVKEVFSGLFIHDAHDEAARRQLFDLARAGYEALWGLVDEDRQHVDARAREFANRTEVSDAELSAQGGKGSDRGVVVGVHVRRGDRRPREFQYMESYIPLNVYAEHARDLLDKRFGSAVGGAADTEVDAAARRRSLVVLASDDPTVYESEEFSAPSWQQPQQTDSSSSTTTTTAGPNVARAQERIRLASKQAIQEVNPNRRVMHHFVDETFGWEGGFFAAMFWNLGVVGHSSGATAASATASAAGKLQQQQQQQQQHPLRNLGPRPSGKKDAAPPMDLLQQQQQLQPSAETLRLRALVGRAYVMDLAVLSDASDAVVCAVSSAGCRLLAVMMGWEKAVENGMWINVDGSYGWSGVAW